MTGLGEKNLFLISVLKFDLDLSDSCQGTKFWIFPKFFFNIQILHTWKQILSSEIFFNNARCLHKKYRWEFGPNIYAQPFIIIIIIIILNKNNLFLK
jgi:hypothetical protein